MPVSLKDFMANQLANSAKKTGIPWEDKSFKELAKLIDNFYSLKDFPNPSEPIQQIAVQHNPKNLKFIDNPSYEVQKIAIDKSIEWIKHIKVPHKAIQKMVIDTNPMYIMSMRYMNPAIEIEAKASIIKGMLTQLRNLPITKNSIEYKILHLRKKGFDWSEFKVIERYLND
jgi:hypothetical protein